MEILIDGTVKCLFDEMVEKGLIPGHSSEKMKFEGFTVGRGTQMFWHYNPTSNGFYAIYPQYENGDIGRPRYIDGTITKVVCHPVNKLKSIEET